VWLANETAMVVVVLTYMQDIVLLV